MTTAPLDLLQGTLDVLILKTLTWGPMHGYGVSRCIRRHTRDVLAVEDAALEQRQHRADPPGGLHEGRDAGIGGARDGHAVLDGAER